MVVKPIKRKGSLYLKSQKQKLKKNLFGLSLYSSVQIYKTPRQWGRRLGPFLCSSIFSSEEFQALQFSDSDSQWFNALFVLESNDDSLGYFTNGTVRESQAQSLEDGALLWVCNKN